MSRFSSDKNPLPRISSDSLTSCGMDGLHLQHDISMRPQEEPLFGEALIVTDLHDDDFQVAATIEGFGLSVDYAIGCTQATSALSQRVFDVMVVHARAGSKDGARLCRLVRSVLKSSVPIIIVGANDAHDDLCEAVRAGADDFIRTPVCRKELRVRLASLIRRSYGNYGSTFRVGDLVLDHRVRRVTRSGIEMTLTPIMYRILWLLMRDAPGVVSRTRLEQDVWRGDCPNSDSLRSHVHRIRKIIDEPFQSRMVRTAHGFGYWLSGA